MMTIEKPTTRRAVTAAQCPLAVLVFDVVAETDDTNDLETFIDAHYPVGMRPFDIRPVSR